MPPLLTVSLGFILAAVPTQSDFGIFAKINIAPGGAVAVVVFDFDIEMARIPRMRKNHMNGFAIDERFATHHIVTPFAGAVLADVNLVDIGSGFIDEREIGIAGHGP